MDFDDSEHDLNMIHNYKQGIYDLTLGKNVKCQSKDSIAIAGHIRDSLLKVITTHIKF